MQKYEIFFNYYNIVNCELTISKGGSHFSLFILHFSLFILN